MRSFILPLALCAGSAAFADIQVTFDEGAPKDRFTVVHMGGCVFGPIHVDIDLSGSAAGLIFDVTATGAGVQVFQPAELVAGDTLLSVPLSIKDGDTLAPLALNSMAPGETVAFTIDVDDTVSGRQTVVNGAEIEGAFVRVAYAGTEHLGAFDRTGVARVAMPACVS